MFRDCFFTPSKGEIKKTTKELHFCFKSATTIVVVCLDSSWFVGAVFDLFESEGYLRKWKLSS
jgi:hypothetical protein